MFCRFPKVHNVGTPLRTIVSSRGSIMCSMAKELSNIIWALVGQSPHHLVNTQQFMDQIKTVRPMTSPVSTKGCHDVKWCQGTIHLTNGTNCYHSSTHVTTGPPTPQEDFYIFSPNHHPAGVLSKNSYFSSLVSIMNRSMVQPWVPPLALPLLIC